MTDGTHADKVPTRRAEDGHTRLREVRLADIMIDVLRRLVLVVFGCSPAKPVSTGATDPPPWGSGTSSEPGTSAGAGVSTGASGTSQATGFATSGVPASSASGVALSASEAGSTSTGELGGTSAATGSTGTSTGTGPRCPSPEEPGCALPEFLCKENHCGSVMSAWDADGQLRPRCSTSCPCGAGMTCFHVGLWGGCTPSILLCDEDCHCLNSDDCGGAYCVPAELVPPEACGWAQDEQSCTDAGCTLRVGREVFFDEEKGGTCECGALVPHCLWFAGPALESPGAGLLFRNLAFGYVFPGTWSQPPFAWLACTGGPADGPVCKCMEQCDI